VINKAEVQAIVNTAFGDSLTESQLEAAINGALRFYSRYNPRFVRSILSLVAGTDSYNLPDDFVILAWLEWWPDGEPSAVRPRTNELWEAMYAVLVDTAKSTRLSPYVHVAGQQLLLDVDPVIAEDIEFAYYGVQVLDTMPEVDTDILVKLAIAEVLLTKSPEFSIAPNTVEGLTSFQFHRVPMNAAQAASILRQEVKAKYGGY